MQTYLLTYNPDSPHWPEERMNRLRDEIARASQGELVRWNCVKGVVEGDNGLLLRQGDVRGIFGLAEATGNAFEKEGRYYAFWRLNPDVLVNPETDRPIILTLELKDRFPDVHWDTQKSGISVQESVADELTREILAGRE